MRAVEMSVLGLGLGITRAARQRRQAPLYDPAAVALFARMSVQPTAARKQLYSDFIAGLKTDGLWAALDAAWVIAAHDAQAARLNLKSASHTLSLVNSPAFTVDRGYAGDGSTSYIDTLFTPSTDGVAYALNSASIGAYINGGTNTTDSNRAAIGTQDAGGNTAVIVARGNGGELRGRVNVTSSTEAFGPVASRYGFSVLSRTASNLTTGYKNGVSASTSATTTSSLPAASFLIGASRFAGAALPSTLNDNRYAFAFVGAGLSAAQAANLNARVQTFLTAIGANA